MKHPNETAIVYNAIKKDSSLTDEQLTAVGVSKERISKALDQCISKGVSRKKAMDTVFKMWKNADPDGQDAPTDKELQLMGFVNKDGTWIHSLTNVSFSEDQVKSMPFREVEQAVFKAAHDIHSKEAKQ